MKSINLISSLLGYFDQSMTPSNRNLVVDSNKEVWSATSSVLTAIRNYVAQVMTIAGCGLGGAGTYSQIAFQPGDGVLNNMPGPYKFYGQLGITTASTGTLAARTTPQLGYFVEEVSNVDGRSVTLSVWLRTIAGTVNLTQASIQQVFGTGGSATVTTTKALNWNITTTWQRFSVRLDTPSAAGKVYGTTPNYTLFILEFPPGSTYSIQDAKPQIEKSSSWSNSDVNGFGGNPTSWEYLGEQQEASRVTRYYNSICISVRGYAAVASSNFDTTLSWPTMLMTPTPALLLAGSALNWGATLVVGALIPNGGRAEITAAAPGDVYALNYIYSLNARPT